MGISQETSPIFTRGASIRFGSTGHFFIFYILFTTHRKDTVTNGNFASKDEKEALMKCFRNDWLHTDKLDDIGRPDEFGYVFASSPHH